MRNIFKIFGFCSLCALALFLTAGDAYADDVLQAVRDKAASFLKGLQPVIFILAGFGLVGFAWMAIFNKISWKWFANIAMGLFLVANMGLFIDYFATKEGKGREYHGLLDYGDYLVTPAFTPTSGTASGPKSQTAKNDGSVTGKEGESGGTPNSDSDQLGSSMTPGIGSSGAGSGLSGGFGSSGTGNGLGSGLFGGSGGTGGSSGGDSFLSPEVQAGMDDMNQKVRSLMTNPVDCIKAGGKWISAINKCM